MMKIEYKFPKKVIPIWTDDWFIFGMHGGRISSKSTTAAQKMISWALNKQNSGEKFGCFRQIQKSIKDSSKSILENTIKKYHLDHYFYSTQTDLICRKTGVEFIFSGLQNHTIDSIRSIEKLTKAWVEEAHTITKESIEVLEPTLIRNQNAQIIYTWNDLTEKTPIHQHLMCGHAPPKAKTLKINYLDNPFCSKLSLDVINAMRQKDYELYQHIYLGAFRVFNKNAIFTKELIDQHRISKLPDFKLVVVGVDPTGGDVKKSKQGGNDEWGIIVCGITIDNIAVVIEDRSGTFKPAEASKIIATLYEKYQGGFIVAEDNFGGQMVGECLKIANKNMQINLARAISSKRHRANPILNRYEVGAVKHFGYHSQLEFQMTDWDEDKKYSPDRLDAMVHAMRFLFKINESLFKIYAV